MEEKLIRDLEWQLTFVSEPEFDFEHFKETLAQLEELRKSEEI